MSYIEKEKLIKADLIMIENRVRHAFNKGYELGLQDGKERAKPLEQEPILDKIRAEIKTKYDGIPWRNNDYDDGWIEALEWVFDDVIGKYKAESEETEQ